MNPKRIAIKLFTSRDVGLHEMQPFIGVFHRFIQEAAVPGLLIDVADYMYVPDGPGVILIGHDVDYGIDRTGGRSGMLTVRKRAGDLAAPGLLRDTMAMAIATAKALEDDDAVSIDFAFDAALVAFPDRLAAPNTAESAALMTKELDATLRGFFGDGISVAHDSAEDPRRMLTLRISGGSADLASLIAQTEQS
jgi:hypothetical protein